MLKKNVNKGLDFSQMHSGVTDTEKMIFKIIKMFLLTLISSASGGISRATATEEKPVS